MSDIEELRALVREVIRDVLPSGLPGDLPVTETVNLSTDEDLAAFVKRLLDLAPGQREELRSGRKRFRLPEISSVPPASQGPSAPSVPPGAPHGAERAGESTPVRRIERGAVTEAVINQAARAGQRLVLGHAAIPGDALGVSEVTPALFAAVAANEAERAAPGVTLVDVSMIGAAGRIYLSGPAAEVRRAQLQITDVLLAVAGRDHEG